jgi:hypothetical protein
LRGRGKLQPVSGAARTQHLFPLGLGFRHFAVRRKSHADYHRRHIADFLGFFYRIIAKIQLGNRLAQQFAETLQACLALNDGKSKRTHIAMVGNLRSRLQHIFELFRIRRGSGKFFR